MIRRLAVAALVLALAACSGAPPFARGAGSDGYRITVEIADAGNLVPNAEVKVNDVTVGTVTGIRVVRWHGELTASLEPTVRLPADARARIGQKSLLGAQFLELAAPQRVTDTRPLAAGDVIPLDRTGTYPQTEDLLIAVATVLNGSGLSRLRTITTELDAALAGRTDEIRSLLRNLATATRRLRAQRADLVRLLDRLDRLGRVLARQTPRVERALPALAPGLRTLDAERPALTRALRALDQLDATATGVLAANRTGLARELRQLRPAVRALADAGDALPRSLDILGTILFPLSRVDTIFQGDYVNVYAEVDLRPATLEHVLVPGLAELLTGSR